VVRVVMEEVAAAFPRRHLEVRYKGDGQGEWDPDRLAQVVQNLVFNALKYGPADAAVRVDTQAAQGEVVLLVHNEGPPIPPEKLRILFEPLQRAASQTDKASRSIGLGLFIVKQIVSAHEGTVSVQSVEDGGTTFAVRLPRRVTAKA
jgi:signal transduction histidine kinase